MNISENELKPIDYKKIRENYRLSKAGMSKVLGFGINQWRLYEDGEQEPNKSNELLIQLIRDPLSMRKLLISSDTSIVEQIGFKRYVILRARVDEILRAYFVGEDERYKKWVDSLYV